MDRVNAQPWMAGPGVSDAHCAAPRMAWKANPSSTISPSIDSKTENHPNFPLPEGEGSSFYAVTVTTCYIYPPPMMVDAKRSIRSRL